MHSVGFEPYRSFKDDIIHYDSCPFSLQRWSRDKIFSFVPPDGKFILAEYRYSPSTSSSSAIARISAASSSAPPLGTSITKDNVPIPFVLKTNFDLQEYNGMIYVGGFLINSLKLKSVSFFRHHIDVSSDDTSSGECHYRT